MTVCTVARDAYVAHVNAEHARHAFPFSVQQDLRANLPFMVRTSLCPDFVCESGHRVWRECPGCTYVGGAVSRECCADHTL